MRRRSQRTRAASEKQSNNETNQKNTRKQQSNAMTESDTKVNENHDLPEVLGEATSTTPTGTPTKSRRQRPVLWKQKTENEPAETTQTVVCQDNIACEINDQNTTDQVNSQDGDSQNSSEQIVQDEEDKGKFNESNTQNNSTSDQNETEKDNVQGITDSPHKDTKYPDANDVQNCNESTISKGSEVIAADGPEIDNFQSEYSIKKADELDEGSSNEKVEDMKKDEVQPSTEDTNKPLKLPPKKITLKRLQSNITVEDKKVEMKPRSSADNNSFVEQNSTEPSIEKAQVISTDEEKTLKRRHSDTISEDKEKKLRRSSVTSCENKTELEAKVQKHHPKIRLIRQRSFAGNVTDDTSVLPKPKKSSHWGCSSGWFSNINASLYKIDIDAVKIVCPTIEFLNEDEVKLEPVYREKEKKDLEKTAQVWTIKDDAEKTENREEMNESTANMFTHNRKVSIIDSFQDSEQSTQNSNHALAIGPPIREASPAKHPVSQVLYITNLVRPFTIKQLRELLQRTGNIVEEGFWTDKIKSKCYVQYETEDEAIATRNALHGINWPISNGKKLKIDYATVEDLEKARNPVPTAIVDLATEKENKQVPADVKEIKIKEEKEDFMKKNDFIREWDKNKEDLHKRSRSRSRERVRKHSRRSYTPEGYPKKHKKHEDTVPQKLMDDLFLKTKTTPSIYWQPLSPEEIAKKQHQRLVCMEEHKRRIEENRERNRESRHGPYRRR